MKKILFILLAGLLPYFISGCEQVPYTEREQLALLPPPQLVELGNQQFTQLLEEVEVVEDTPTANMVDQVGRNLVDAAMWFMREYNIREDLGDIHWRFALLKNDEVINAFAVPGGNVGLFTGIMPVAQNRQGTAVILAHELAHVLAQHGNERMTQQILLRFGAIVLTNILETRSQQVQEIFRAVYGIGTTLAIVLPYSRQHEAEADKLGLILMARAGYDPRDAIDFWQRMKEQAGETPPQLLSTHPLPENRIEEIRNFIPVAMQFYRPQAN